MFCHKCGNKLKDNDKFCDGCGTTILSENSTIKTKKDIWKWISYGWTVVVGLITIGVVSGIYSSLYQSFEIIVVSLLILIYLSIQTFAMTYGNTTIENTFATYTEFKRLRKLISKDEIDTYDEEIEQEAIQEARKKTDRAKVKMYINAGFALIIYIMALWNLFGAL